MRIVIDDNTFKQLLENCKDKELADYAKMESSHLSADDCQLVDFCMQKEIDYRLKKLKELMEHDCSETGLAYELRALIDGLLRVQACFIGKEVANGN